MSRGTLIIGMGEAAFFVDSRYRSGCQDLTCVTVHNETFESQKEFISKLSPSCIVCDPNELSVNQYRKLEGLPLQDGSPISQMRVIKDSDELNLLRKSAKLNAAAYRHLLDSLKVGMTENEAAWKFEEFARENGAEKMGFGPTVAFGKGTSIPHYQTADVLLEEGMPVLIDVGVVKDHYHSDMTRSFFFWGEDAEYQETLDLVVSAQKEACAMLKPGIPIYKIDQHIRNRFKEKGVADAFLHGTGHGLGLQIHESPTVNSQVDPSIVLKEGMVITIEPGLYFEGKWGIRHEDTLIITHNGSENLYSDLYGKE